MFERSRQMMYRRCAPSAAETGRASLGVQSSVLGRATLITLTDRTRLAPPPITCASCAENACLTGLNAVSEQGQVRVVEVALPRFDLIVGQAAQQNRDSTLHICVRLPSPIGPVCGRRRCRRRGSPSRCAVASPDSSESGMRYLFDSTSNSLSDSFSMSII